MEGPVFDQATRVLGTATRRTPLRTVAGLVLGGVTAGFTGVRSQAAEHEGEDLRRFVNSVAAEKKSKKQKRKEKRCKKDGRQCSVAVAGFCGAVWLDYDSCRASLGSCCSQIRNCKYGAGASCIENNPYYFLA